jgi:hypothetical protein
VGWGRGVQATVYPHGTRDVVVDRVVVGRGTGLMSGARWSEREEGHEDRAATPTGLSRRAERKGGGEGSVGLKG